MTDQSRLDDLIDGLNEPFPKHAIEQRQGGGNKMFDYVATETVIRRLNRVAVAWDFEVTSHTLIGDVLVVFGKLTIPGLGTRSGTGVQKLQGGEDTIKGAASDCLKKCATLFGVALDLCGPDLEAGEIRGTTQAQPNAPGRAQPAVPGVGDVPLQVADWTDFWKVARLWGLNDAAAFTKATGGGLGSDPGYAYERLLIWRKDATVQGQMA